MIASLIRFSGFFSPTLLNRTDIRATLRTLAAYRRKNIDYMSILQRGRSEKSHPDATDAALYKLFQAILPPNQMKILVHVGVPKDQTRLATAGNHGNFHLDRIDPASKKGWASRTSRTPQNSPPFSRGTERDQTTPPSPRNVANIPRDSRPRVSLPHAIVITTR